MVSSAAEYVMTDREGRIVSLTDEAFGFGFLTYQCEGNGNCASTGTTTKPVITTSGTTASTQGTLQSFYIYLLVGYITFWVTTTYEDPP